MRSYGLGCESSDAILQWNILVCIESVDPQFSSPQVALYAVSTPRKWERTTQICSLLSPIAISREVNGEETKFGSKNRTHENCYK